jgi:hypothetical protein
MFEAKYALGNEEALLEQRDWRADGGARRVRVTRSDILISRRFSGVNMMITVPVPAYYGVALDVMEGDDGAPCYRLSLAHRDRDLDVVLTETQNSADAASDWNYWARYLGLPRLSAGNGKLEVVDSARGSRSGQPRRRGGTLRLRRPRFLTRRRPGVAARMAEVFSDEREIICYE